MRRGGWWGGGSCKGRVLLADAVFRLPWEGRAGGKGGVGARNAIKEKAYSPTG